MTDLSRGSSLGPNQSKCQYCNAAYVDDKSDDLTKFFCPKCVERIELERGDDLANADAEQRSESRFQ